MRNPSRAAVLVGFLLGGCLQAVDDPVAEADDWAQGVDAEDVDTSGRRPTLTYVQPPARSVLRVDPAEMLDAVRDGYHPRPDRRFLLAIAQVHHLLTEESLGEVESTYQDGAWSIAYKGEGVGRLPELADLRDAMPVLRELAGRYASARPLGPPSPDQERALAEIRRLIAEFDAANLAEALRRLDGMWRAGQRSSPVPVLAAHALSALYLQSYDRLDLGDALPAKVLAAIVVARALADASLVQEEALLANDMGYTTHADSLAATLPPGDPVALYLSGDEPALRRLAEAADGSHHARYLYTLHLSHTADSEELAAWTGDYGLEPSVFGLAQIKPLFLTGEFEVDAQLAGLGPYIALYDLWKTVLPHEALREIADARISRLGPRELGRVGRAIRSGASVPGGLLAQRFENDLRLLDRRFHGPFLDAATFATFFSAHFYSAEWKLGRHILDAYSSVPLAQEFAVSLVGSPTGPAQELERWYDHLTDAKAGTPSAGDLLGDLASLELLGNTALGRTYDELLKHLPYADPGTVRAGKLYASHLDARLGNRSKLAAILRGELHDLTGAEAYYRSILAASRNSGQIDMWMTRYMGDLEGLVAQVQDPRIRPSNRMYGWRLLRGRPEFIGDQELRRLAQDIIGADPDSWDLRDDYARYLRDQHAYEAALPVIDEWLEGHDASDGFPFIYATTSRATTLGYMGRFDEAWEALGPVRGSGQAGAMGRGAWILERLGRHDEARRRAESMVRTYPTGIWGRSVLAEILWRQNLPEDAARALHAPGYPIGSSEWRNDIAPAFVSAFKDRRPGEARDAFRALLAEGIAPWDLEGLPQGIRGLGEKELALTVQLELHPTGAVGSLRMLLPPYRSMVELRGPEEALAWIRAQIPRDLRNAFSLVAYGEGAWDLLWTVTIDPEEGEYPSSVWLMRTFAHVLQAEDAPGRKEALLAHYRRAGDADPYDVMGAHLMGLVAEDRLFALATAPDRRCEIAYALGVKAQADGRLQDAVDWFRVVVESEQTREFEYGWATRQLDRWRNQTRRIEGTAEAEAAEER